MTLTLTLSPELERRLTEEAQRHGLTSDQYMLQLLDRYLPRPEQRAELIALLQSWIDDGDAAEQRATGEYLVGVLDEDRLSDRKLFPPELQGVTW